MDRSISSASCTISLASTPVKAIRGQFLGAHVRRVHRDVEVAVHAELRAVLRELVVGAHLEVALFESETLVALGEEPEIALHMHSAQRNDLKFTVTIGGFARLATFGVIECRKIGICKLERIHDTHGELLWLRITASSFCVFVSCQFYNIFKLKLYHFVFC